MIKSRCSGESAQGGDDRPRKKLSFRDPEVTPPKSTPLSAPAKTCSPPRFSRPHSVSGVMGLGGFSASGGVPGMSNPASSSSSLSNNPKGVTSSPGIHSPNLPSRLFHHVSSHSPTRLTSRSHSRHSSYDGIQNIQEQDNFQEQKEQHSQHVTQKQAHHSSQQHYEHGSQQPHKEQQYRQPQQSPVNHVQLDQQYPKQDQNPGPQNQNQYPQSLQQNQQPHQPAQQTQQQQLQNQNHPNQQNQLHEQQTQQKQHTVQSKKQNLVLQEVQQSYSHESNKQKHNQQQLKNQIQLPQTQQSQLHLHPKQFSQQQSKNQNQFSYVQQNQFQEYDTEFQYSEHEVQKYHDPQIQQKRQSRQASVKQSLNTSEKKDQASKSSPKPQQSKVHRHHSLSPKRHTRLDAVPSGRNSDQMLFCHSEDIESENQAMKVVRTVGQAFEVVHKLTLKDKSPSPDSHNDDDVSREGSEDSSDKPKKDGLDSESGQEDLMTLTSDTYNEDALENLHNRPSNLEPLALPIGSEILHKNIGETFASPLGEPLSLEDYLPQTGTPLSVHHELQLLREQLEQQQQQTQAAVAQVHLLRDQLAAETAARLEAQARTHQLLVHNKELLEHIQQLVLQVRDLEVKLQGGGGVGGNGVSTTILMPPNPPEMKSEQRSHPQHQSQYQTQQQQQQQAMRQRHYPFPHESGIDVDVKREGVDSSRRLPQVPEDSVSNIPLGASPIGSQRGPPPNGPITRAASERYSRQETLAQLQRMAWARHTTK